jgi:chromosome segregation ATPase
MPYHTKNAIMSGDDFEKIQMAVDNLKQGMEDENWVNMDQDAEDWLTDNAEDHGYLEMGDSGVAEEWLSDNAEDHGYVNAAEHEQLQTELDEALEMQEQYSQDADRCTEAEATTEKLKAEVKRLTKENEKRTADYRDRTADYVKETNHSAYLDRACSAKRAEIEKLKEEIAKVPALLEKERYRERATNERDFEELLEEERGHWEEERGEFIECESALKKEVEFLKEEVEISEKQLIGLDHQVKELESFKKALAEVEEHEAEIVTENTKLTAHIEHLFEDMNPGCPEVLQEVLEDDYSNFKTKTAHAVLTGLIGAGIEELKKTNENLKKEIEMA